MTELFEYNAWANRQIVDAATPLEGAEFTRDLGSSFRSVRDTLVHILYAEWVWLRRCLGESPRTVHSPADFPDIESVRRELEDIDRRWIDYERTLDRPALEATVTYVNVRGETWTYPRKQILLHLSHHSAYHRGQVVTMLRQLGRRPPGTDLLMFVDATAS